LLPRGQPQVDRTALDLLALSTCLEVLTLEFEAIGVAAKAAAALLVRSCALKRLALRDDAPARVLAAVAPCSQLQHFSLYILPFANFRVSACQLESLAAAVKSANALEPFELSGARISNDKGNLGAALSQCGALASVNLNYTRRLALQPLPQIRIFEATFCMCSLPRRTAGALFSELRELRIGRALLQYGVEVVLVAAMPALQHLTVIALGADEDRELGWSPGGEVELDMATVAALLAALPAAPELACLSIEVGALDCVSFEAQVAALVAALPRCRALRSLNGYGGFPGESPFLHAIPQAIEQCMQLRRLELTFVSNAGELAATCKAAKAVRGL